MLMCTESVLKRKLCFQMHADLCIRSQNVQDRFENHSTRPKPFLGNVFISSQSLYLKGSYFALLQSLDFVLGVY